MENKWGKTIRDLLEEKDGREREWQKRIKAGLADRNFFAKLRALGKDFAKRYIEVRKTHQAVGENLDSIGLEIQDIKDNLKK